MIKSNLDMLEASIADERQNAKRGLETQAETMVESSNKRFKDAIVVQNVTIKIPDVDRGVLAMLWVS